MLFEYLFFFFFFQITRALFNGKHGDFLNMASSCLDGAFLPNGTPLEKMIAEQKGNNISMDANFGKKKDDSKKKKSGKDSKNSRNTREATSNKGKVTGKGQSPLKGKTGSKASSKNQKAQNKLSSPSRKGSDALNKKKLDESAKYRTPKQVCCAFRFIFLLIQVTNS